MAVNLPDPADSLAKDAAADLSAARGLVVYLNTSGLVALAGANQAGFRGIVTEGAKAGNPASFQHGSIAKGIAGGTFNPGVSVTSDAAGKLVLAITGQNALGWSITGGTAGKWVTLKVHPHTAP